MACKHVFVFYALTVVLFVSSSQVKEEFRTDSDIPPHVSAHFLINRKVLHEEIALVIITCMSSSLFVCYPNTTTVSLVLPHVL